MKKNIKKLLVMTLIAAVSMSSLTGCGKGKSTASDGKTLTVGTNAEFPPFEYVSSDNGVIDEYSGIDMEIIKKIAEDNGMTAKVNNMEFDSLTVALKNGQVDAVIAGMTITDERKEEVDFSNPYYEAKQVMIVKNDSDIKKASDMKDKSIAVVLGYTGETAVKDLGYKYEAFKKGTEAVQELVNGKCDVVVIDSATANQYIKDNEGLKIVEDDKTFPAEEYGIAVKKGNTELLDKINSSIKKMQDDGEIDKISAENADMNSSSTSTDSE